MVLGGVGYDLDCVDKLIDILSFVSDSCIYKSFRNVIFGGFFINLFNCDNFDEEEDFVWFFILDFILLVSSFYESEELLVIEDYIFIGIVFYIDYFVLDLQL